MGSMAILEEEVLVGLNPSTIVYFEKLGYKIPKYIDKKNRPKIKTGTKILVRVKDLSEHSNVKLTKICDDCGEKCFNVPYQTILISRKNTDGKDRCKKCGCIWSGINKKKNIDYEKSLEYCAKKENKEYLLKEFSNKNVRKPNQIAYKSNDTFLWCCEKCTGEYLAKLSNRTNGRNCPYCSGRKVLKGYNDLWTTNPEIAKLLKDKQLGYEITAGSNKKEWFVCPDCGIEQRKMVWNVYHQKFSCFKCNDGISYPEKFVMCLLDQLQVEYEREKSFNWSNGKLYDFYIPSLNLIIETHGIQHYYDNGFSKFGGKTLDEEMTNDKYKMELTKINKIENYVVIDCRTSNLDYIRNSITNSKLGTIFNLNNISWHLCDEYSSKTLIKMASNLWNQGKNTFEIGEILKFSRSTIIKYLKQGNKLNWCNYDPKEEQKKIGRLHGGKNAKRVVQLTLNNQYIKTWNSLMEIEKELGIKFGNVSAVCRGDAKSASNFKWMFEDDYERNKDNLSVYKKETRGRCVVKLDLEGNYINEYPSITKAAESLDGNKINGIYLTCIGKRNKAGKFKWMFKEDYEQQLTF
jgi:hypothetical protein